MDEEGENTYDPWELDDEDHAYFDKLKKVLVEAKVAEYLTKHTAPLVNEESLMQRFQEEVDATVDQTYSLVQLGYFALMRGVHEIYPEMDYDEAEKLKNEIDRWTGILVDLGPYSEFLQRVIQSKKNLQEAFYLSNESIAWFYQVGRYYLHLKEYDQAAGVFYLLIQLNPKIFEFWIGLAACYQEQKLYEEAIHAYEKGKEQRPDDPTFDLFIAECFLALQNKSRAESHLESAKKLLQSTHQNHPLKGKLEFLTNQINISTKG